MAIGVNEISIQKVRYVTVYHGRPGFDPRQGQEIFLLVSASRPALGPTQPPIQWVPGGPFSGGKVQRVKEDSLPRKILQNRPKEYSSIRRPRRRWIDQTGASPSA
jgi:hypothetical protein